MSWKCPNGCHKEEGFAVARDEYREDTIVHFYKADDGDLAASQGHKVYVGDNSTYGPAQCGICEAEVTWTPQN